MGRRCCIEGCSSRSNAKEHNGVTYHSFPLDANIRAMWMKNARLQADRNITKSVLVCSRHFRRADFQPMKSGKYLLKQRVCPTVFPWGKLDAASIPDEDPSSSGSATGSTTPALKTSSASEAATTATVEATIAQIFAETAELNAAAGIKPPPEADPILHLRKRGSAEQSGGEERPAKQARNTADSTSTPVNVIGSTKFEPVTLFNPGARLEAQDFDGVWHAARVVEVDMDDREVLIKFEKSGKSKSAAIGSEEWIPMNSSRLRQKISTKPVVVFELEDKVMARWTGPRRFPATIKKILGNDMYEVLFDDGFVKNVRANHMTKVSQPTEVALSTEVAQPATPSPVTPPAATKQKKSSPAATTPASKPKRGSAGARKDWPLLSMDKLDMASLNLPDIPKDGEWTCHWVNDQPIGKEGFLIVGEHKKPTVIVEDWRLPPGWVKHMYQRSNVLGKWDVILVTPNGKRFRSKADLKVFLEEQGQVYNPDIYDFSIHRRRAKDINAYAFTDDYTPQPPKPKADTSLSSIGTPVKSLDIPLDASPQSTAAALVSTLTNSGTSQYIETPVATPVPPMELMTPTTDVKQEVDGVVESAAAAPPTDTTTKPEEDGYAYIGGLKVKIVDNLFRCPQEGCTKNFRKENHLQIHVKHYHQDLIKLLGACPKMQELAEKRSLGTPDSNEPHPKNQISNQQFFAKLHQQDLQSRSHRRSVGTTSGTTTGSPTTGDAQVTETPVVDPEDNKSSLSGDNLVTIKTEESNNDDKPNVEGTTGSAAVADASLINTTADSSMMDLSVASSTAEDSPADQSTASVVHPTKRSRFSPSKRTPGSRKSNRQRTTRRYLTAAQATAGAPLPPVVTADSANNSASGISVGDFEETRHSFNATPDAKPSDTNVNARKRKMMTVIAAPATPLSSLDSPVTADSGSSSFQPLHEEPSRVSAATVVGGPAQYIKENGELIKIVRMRQEEIINCLCSYGEEDGLMIQCELCLCWQHGICNGIDKESDVPEKYVCYICRNPQRGRESMRYKHDQDWLYEGKLPVASYHNPNPDHLARFELLKRSHTLTGNLVELKRFMHSLRVKINIANNKGHPKMYLWAKKWDEDETKSEVKVEEEEIKIETSEETESQKKDAESGSDKDTQDRTSDDLASKKIKSEPSTPARLPAMPNIPQPEAPIEPVECQHRLLEHIKVQQRKVMDRLANIETEIDDLEKLDHLPDLKNTDLSTTKDVISSFIKELEIMKQIANVNALENLKQSMTDNPPILIK